MTKEEEKLLSTFESKLRYLLVSHDKLKSENAKLKERIDEQEQEKAALLEEYDKLNTEYTNLKTAETINLSFNDIRETKTRLSKLVREVDKCIALLNE